MRPNAEHLIAVALRRTPDHRVHVVTSEMIPSADAFDIREPSP
jgi:hypothetical protein